ncbi:MAG: hypothetical protein F6J92_04710 [Symploca sp. SIO1A3]|nr:hypothetical protein [Symploca sp. SIO1A3]NER45984.1 hypothetical protein [Symploca sp. SIO1A3]
MPRKSPPWKKLLPEFLEAIDCAENDEQIQQACAEIKQAVVESYPDTPSSRRNPMTEIREAIRERYPVKKTKKQKAQYPYYFTDAGKGRVKRWEHLAIKHLREDWNIKTTEASEKSDTITPAPATLEQSENIPPSPKPETSIDIFTEVGLEGEELAIVEQALGDADINEWIKQALLQRAKAINALHERLNEDLSLVKSDELMNDKKYRTNPNASRELASRAIRAIKDWNDNQPEHKWCITNKLISSLTGVTPKAIAKVVEGMGIEDYNQMMGLTPVVNRMTKAAVGSISEEVSIADMLGID